MRSTALRFVFRFCRDSTGHRTFHHRADDRSCGIQALRLQFPLGQFHAFSPGALSCRWGSAVEQTHLSERAFRLAFWLSLARGRLPQEDRLDGRIHQRFGVLAQSRFLRHRVCISYSCGRLEFWLRCMLSGLRRTSLSSARSAASAGRGSSMEKALWRAPCSRSGSRRLDVGASLVCRRFPRCRGVFSSHT